MSNNNNEKFYALIEKYLDVSDWQVNQDSNIQFSFPGLQNHVFEGVIKNYSLDVLMPKDLSEAYKKGEIYIHDLGKHLVGYCAGWDIRAILMKGISGVAGKCSTGPAKHLQTALDHISRFILIVCNEWSGAQAVNSLDTYMAPFIEEDRLNYKEVKSCIQSFMYNLSISTRYGGQVPFSNITLDWVVPEDLKEEQVIIGGKMTQHKYGEYQREMNMFNKALLEVYKEGDYEGKPFHFPIPTYNLTKDFDWDNENAELLFEMTAKYGTPYFQNFINSDLKPGDIRAMCCRLNMDMRELRNKTGGLWGAGASTGSIGVVDVNLPRIGYECKGNIDIFYKLLEERMDKCMRVLEDKRKLITENLNKGLMPYTKKYLGTFDRHFSTIGLIGMNEAMLNLFGKDLTAPECIKMGREILNFMKNKLKEYQVKTGNLYNLEATPNESCSYHLALRDKDCYPDIITAGVDEPYYTNSSQLPVSYTDDVFEALDLQEPLQSTYTGGTVFHVFLGEKISSGEECKKLVKKIAEKYKIPYFSITPTFSVCPKHGYIAGEAKKCSNKKCNVSPLIYSRVVGFYRPVAYWHNGKKEEYKQRKEYDNKCNW